MVSNPVPAEELCGLHVRESELTGLWIVLCRDGNPLKPLPGVRHNADIVRASDPDSSEMTKIESTMPDPAVAASQAATTATIGQICLHIAPSVYAQVQCNQGRICLVDAKEQTMYLDHCSSHTVPMRGSSCCISHLRIHMAHIGEVENM